MKKEYGMKEDCGSKTRKRNVHGPIAECPKEKTLLWTVFQLFMRNKGGIIGSGLEMDGDRLDNGKGAHFMWNGSLDRAHLGWN